MSIRSRETQLSTAPGPEFKVPGTGETLQSNRDGSKKGAAGGNCSVVVDEDGDENVRSGRYFSIDESLCRDSRPLFGKPFLPGSGIDACNARTFYLTGAGAKLFRRQKNRRRV